MENAERHRQELRRTAETAINQALGWGIGLLIAGVIVMVLGWPGADILSEESDGSPIAVLIGRLIFWAGSLVLGIGVVAHGVRLGVEAARTPPA